MIWYDKDRSVFNNLGLRKGDKLILNPYGKPVNFAGRDPESVYLREVYVEKEYPCHIQIKCVCPNGATFTSSINKADLVEGAIHIKGIRPNEVSDFYGPDYILELDRLNENKKKYA